jgi:ferritin-like protein
MAGASTELHETEERLGQQVIDAHRALVSIQEELEAVDWYNQRAHATDDADLSAILEHHRDEEKEHASMLLEWLRRHDPAFDRHLRTYLFTDSDITAIEHDAEGDD